MHNGRVGGKIQEVMRHSRSFHLDYIGISAMCPKYFFLSLLSIGDVLDLHNGIKAVET